MDGMSTKEIYNYRKVNEQLITGGQPTEAQLQAAAQEGFTAVINLATYDQRNSLKDEAGLAHSLGLKYYAIPVEWDRPQVADFAEFERVMGELAGEKVLIHCAANYRVTAFYSLYAMKNLGWSEAQADEFRKSIWQGSRYPAWEEFIQQIKTDIRKGNAG